MSLNFSCRHEWIKVRVKQSKQAEETHTACFPQPFWARRDDLRALMFNKVWNFFVVVVCHWFGPVNGTSKGTGSRKCKGVGGDN